MKAKRDALLHQKCVLRASLKENTLRVESKDGRRETLSLTPLSAGGYNSVYVAHGTNLVVRISTKPMNAEEQLAYYREIAVQRELASESLSPQVFAVLHFTPAGECSFDEGAYARETQIGVCMIKFDCTLADVLESPERTARVFVEYDGEEALVALFAKAASIATCVDTKAANVVVRLEPTVAMALIDVDVYFCGVQKRPVPSDPSIAWLGSELKRAKSAPRAKPTTGALVALSLLILCLDSASIATMGQLRRIVLVLLAHAPTVMRLVADDEIAALAQTKGAYAWMGSSESVFRQLSHYASIKRLAEIETKLVAASRERTGARLLRICSSPPDPALFVAAMGSLPRASRSLDRANTQDEIRRLVQSTL
jgi:hypothetical protein